MTSHRNNLCDPPEVTVFLSRPMRSAVLPVLLASLAACAGDGGTAPVKKTDVPQSSASGTPGAVYAAPSDTTHVAEGPTVIRGTVVLITVTPSNGQPVDTSHVSPLPNARLSLSQRVDQNGSSTYMPFAQTTSDASGAFSFGQVPSGYYILKGEGPSGTTYPSAQAYVVTSVSEVVVNFRLVTGL
jgi:hypothetical protein